MLFQSERECEAMITYSQRIIAAFKHPCHSTTTPVDNNASDAFANAGRFRNRAARVGIPIALLLPLFLVGSSTVQASPANAHGSAPSCSAGYVALTYDDGPSDWTWGVSTTLKAFKLRATFFMMGSKVTQNPDTVKKVAADGHIVANHTFDHPRLTDLTSAAIKKEIVDTSSAIKTATGSNPRLFRPPYGATNNAIRAIAANVGMTEVIWTLDTNDWQGLTAQQTADVVSTAKAGDVILMHDDSDIDVQAVPLIAKALSDKRLCTGKIVPSQDPVHVWDGLDYYAKVVAF
jgi:peptidoglycan/xylan/chitin deacetylase (PgdA/CDA1 family)